MSVNASVAPKAMDLLPLQMEGPTSLYTSPSKLSGWPKRLWLLQLLIAFGVSDRRMVYNLSPLPQQGGVMQMLLAAIDTLFFSCITKSCIIKSVELKTGR